MKVGIIGTGTIASALATAFTRKGISVMIGGRDGGKASALASQMHHFAASGTIANTIQFGDIIALAVPYRSVEEILRHHDRYTGKTILDCTNPLVWDEDVNHAFGHTTSAAEQIAGMLPDANVVKAFNTAFGHHIESGPFFGPHEASMFYCGNDAEAKDQVKTLIEAAGFDAVDAGPLYSARQLEAMAVLIIRLARMGNGNEIAFKLLRR